MKRLVAVAIAAGLLAACTTDSPEDPTPSATASVATANPDILAAAITAWATDQGSGSLDAISGSSEETTGEADYHAMNPQINYPVAACSGATGTAQIELSTGETLQVPCTQVGVSPVIGTESITITELTLTATATNVPDGAAWAVGLTTLDAVPTTPTIGATFLQTSVALAAQRRAEVTASSGISESDTESGTAPFLAGATGPVTVWAACSAPSGTMTITLAGAGEGSVPCDPGGTGIAIAFTVDDPATADPVASVSGVAAGSAWAIGFVPAST